MEARIEEQVVFLTSDDGFSVAADTLYDIPRVGDRLSIHNESTRRTSIRVVRSVTRHVVIARDGANLFTHAVSIELSEDIS